MNESEITLDWKRVEDLLTELNISTGKRMPIKALVLRMTTRRIMNAADLQATLAWAEANGCITIHPGGPAGMGVIELRDRANNKKG